jgi:spermidine synthase
VVDELQVPIRGQKFYYTVEVTERICRLQTDWQLIEVVASQAFGRMLLLDGHIQLAEMDEQAYHEALVQIPLISLPEASSALVIGGGDGGVLRELCKHTSIKHIDMAEIDQGVIDVSREHLPGISAGAFDDPRVHVHVTDAFQFVKETAQFYDLIVADSTDTYEGEDGALSESLFTREFYVDCARRLKPGGVMVTQADNLVFCPYSTEGAAKAFREVFANVGIYQSLVPSFGGFSGFCWGSSGPGVVPAWRDPGVLLRYLSETTYNLAFVDLGFNAI